MSCKWINGYRLCNFEDITIANLRRTVLKKQNKQF